MSSSVNMREQSYQKFNNLITERKITPYKVSKDTGISSATLSDWKIGKSMPKTDKLMLLANYFNVPINYFIE